MKTNDTLSKGAGEYKLGFIFLYFISSKCKDGTIKKRIKKRKEIDKTNQMLTNQQNISEISEI